MLNFAKELDNSAEINQNRKNYGLTDNQIVLRDKKSEQITTDNDVAAENPTALKNPKNNRLLQYI